MSRTSSRLQHTVVTLSRYTKQRDLLVQRLHEWTSGFSSGSDEPPVATSGISDPTGRTALDERGDQAAYDLARVAELEQFILHYVAELDGILLRNSVGGHPKPPDTEGCWSCARIQINKVPQYEPVYRSGTVNGNLAESRALGRWCYDFVRKYGRLPARDELRKYHEGHKVRVREAKAS